MTKMNWYKQEVGILNSEAMEELFSLKRRDQHKIFFFLCAIKEYVMEKIEDVRVDFNSEFELKYSILTKKCRLNVTTLQQMIHLLVPFGVEVLQECDTSVTIKYPKFLKLLSSSKTDIDTNTNKDPHSHKEISSVVNTTVESSKKTAENKKQPRIRIDDLSINQKNVKLIKLEDGTFKWDKPEDYSISKDLLSYFPDMSIESINTEVIKLAKNFKSDKFKENKFGFYYIVNCINNSFNRK